MRTRIPWMMLGTVVVTVFVLSVQAAEEKIEPSKLPKEVADALKSRFPDAELTSATKETENGQVVYDLELKQKSRKFESDIKEDGTILEIEKEIAQKDWPKSTRWRRRS